MSERDKRLQEEQRARDAANKATEEYVEPPRLTLIEGGHIDRCPACGEFTDYCQGHGVLGDPDGWSILNAHDNGDHSRCHVNSDCVVCA